MAFFLAPLAPVAKAGLLRGGAYLANKFLRKKAKQQFKHLIPISGGSLPARVGTIPIAGGSLPASLGASLGTRLGTRLGTNLFGKKKLSKIVKGGLATDGVGDFFFPDLEAQAPQIDFDEVNKLVEALDKEKKVSSGQSRADILSRELRRRK